MAEMGFVWKLRGDCVTEQERFKASPVSFFDESGEERKRWGGGGFMSPPHFCHYMALSCMPKDGCTKCDVFLLL